MSADRLRAAEGALRKVQAQAAALEDLSEQLSLSVHVLEAEVAALGERLRLDAERRASAVESPGGATEPGGAPAVGGATAGPSRSTDADGARLVALDMALGGEPREAAAHYLEEHFDVPGRERLLDEVYAATGR